ncbi:PREDICTED: uncharacterized protein LOC107191219 [Dufourea novaeangliae]|uniref:uncharacterized protein LOC107191219 n=1 Tax=Dufourea novaeangliae TaxID=178035 RepID=UPI000767B00B|nr:PREDICTED: uncharacterized protein LOC107191219 [Dufourea novaeangliae]
MNNSVPTNNHIRIAAINVNSIIANYRRLELLQFLETYKHDFVFLSETKLNANHKMSFTDNNLIRTDRANAIQGGGTAILVKKGIEYEIVNFPASINNEILEYTIIRVCTNSNNNIFLISAYTTNDNRILFITELDDLFRGLKLSNGCNYYILAGDLNARHKEWGDRVHNQRGKFIKQWEAKVDLTYRLNLITPALPTFKPSQSFLDICIADSRLMLANSYNGKASTLPYDSDHSAISLEFEILNDYLSLQTISDDGHRFNFKATKWDKFAKFIAQSYISDIPFDRNLSIHEIDSHLHTINGVIVQAIHAKVPKFKVINSTARYLNQKIRKLQKDKSYIVSLLHDLHVIDPLSKLALTRKAKSTLKVLVNALKNEFRLAIESHWVNMLKRINYRRSHSFFPVINKLFRAKNYDGIKELHISQDNVTLINRSKCNILDNQKVGDNVIFSSPADKLNIMGSYYESINSPRYLNNNTRLKEIVDSVSLQLKRDFLIRREENFSFTKFNRVNNAVYPEILDNLTTPFCSPSTVEHIFKKLPNKTSCGLDTIPPIVLKHLLRVVIFDIVILFNNAINISYFPEL